MRASGSHGGSLARLSGADSFVFATTIHTMNRYQTLELLGRECWSGQTAVSAVLPHSPADVTTTREAADA